MLFRSGETRVICSAEFDQYRPCVAASDSGFLAVWADLRAGPGGSKEYDLYARRLNAAGTICDSMPPGAEGWPIVRAPGMQFRPKLAWNGDCFLLVWRDQAPGSPRETVKGMRLSSQGAALAPGTILISDRPVIELAQPAVAAGGGNFAVIWQDGRRMGRTGTDIYATVVDAAGRVRSQDEIGRAHV